MQQNFTACTPQNIFRKNYKQKTNSKMCCIFLLLVIALSVYMVLSMLQGIYFHNVYQFCSTSHYITRQIDKTAPLNSQIVIEVVICIQFSSSLAVKIIRRRPLVQASSLTNLNPILITSSEPPNRILSFSIML